MISIFVIAVSFWHNLKKDEIYLKMKFLFEYLLSARDDTVSITDYDIQQVPEF